jgi:rod shape-determining protein MreC
MQLQRLLELLLRFRDYVVLLALLLVALALMQLHSAERLQALRTVALVLTGLVRQSLAWIPNPFALQRENELLHRINIELMQALMRQQELAAENEQFRSLLQLPARQPLPLLFGELLGRTVGQLQSYATLNRGSADGVRPGMPVVTAAGLVGTVEAVSPHFALVHLLPSRTMRVAVQLQHSGAEGILTWEGRERRFLLRYVPTSVSVQAGEPVVTSNTSDRFPGGIPVGSVRRVEPLPDGLFYRIEVQAAVPFESVRYVAVVLHLPNPERRRLEGQLAP